MSQTVVLEQHQQQQTVATETITLKFNNCESNADSKTPNPLDDASGSKPDPESQSTGDHSVPEPITIPNVYAETEAAVNAFLQKNASMDEDIRTESRNELRRFIAREEISITTLLVLVKYADDVKNADLLDIFCQRIADVIKDKSVEEVREIFNITNDFTPEEEQAIRDEHPWAFED